MLHDTSCNRKSFSKRQEPGSTYTPEFRFKTDEVYIERDEATGVVTLSEKALRRRSMADLFARVDAAGGFDFEVERDRRPPEEREPW